MNGWQSYRMSLFAGAALAVLAGAPSFAQTATPTGSPQTAALEEVIVTADKRSSTSQAVASSLTVISSTDLKRSTTLDLGALEYAVPNVLIDFSGSPRVPRINIRGIYSEASNGGIEPAVPFTIDDVLQGRPATDFNALYDLDHIEVLRGPQGALYGANAIAGVVNVHTQDPTSQFGGYVDVLGGNYGTVATNGAINLPLGDRVFARLSGSYVHHDGYTQNLTLNTAVGDQNNQGIRLGVKVLLTDNIDLLIRAGASSDRDNGAAFDVKSSSAGFLPSAAGGTVDTNGFDRKVTIDTPSYDRRNTYNTSAALNWHLGGGFTLTSITAYQNYYYQNFADADYSNVNLLNTGVNETQNQTSQEFRLTSPNTGKLKYVFGVYYFHQYIADTTLAQLGLGATALGIPKALLPVSYSLAQGNITTDEYAGFGEATYSITNQFEVALGGRYDSVKKGISLVQSANGILGLPALSLSPGIQNSQFSPQGELRYHVLPDVMAYVKVARGFKSGGYNNSTNSNSGIVYQPETLTDYEGGIKSEWFDRRLRINTGIFHYDYSNLQVQQLVKVGIVSQVQSSNAARATSQGAEIEVQAIPVTGLLLSAAYGYTDAKFASFPNATSKGADYSGNQLPLAAKNSVNLVGQYDLPAIASMKPYARIEYEYRDGSFYAASNDPNARLSNVSVANARIGLVGKQNWELAFWGKNIFNDTYSVVINANSFFTQYNQALGAPRTYGVDLSYKF